MFDSPTAKEPDTPVIVIVSVFVPSNMLLSKGCILKEPTKPCFSIDKLNSSLPRLVV